MVKRGKTRRKLRGGADMKPAARCQCKDSNGQQCGETVNDKSAFCKKHANCPLAPTNGFEPEKNPGRYNNDPAIWKVHNCYSYSMNSIDPKLVNFCRKNNLQNCRNKFHQPGALHGERNALNASSRRTCPVVEKLMMADVPNMERSTYEAKCKPNTRKIALVVDKGEDYHFYRQDDNGMWTHKDGSNKVKDYDALKNPIANPELASRDYRWTGSDLNYEDFCGFYCVPHKDVVLEPGESLNTKTGGNRSVHRRGRQAVRGAGLSWTDYPAQTRKQRRRSARQSRRT